jgi:polyisoprenoid-binding protein YceI
MALRHSSGTPLRYLLAFGLSLAVGTSAVTAYAVLTAPLTFATGTISIAGTSNVHAYTASTATVRVTRVQLAAAVAGPTFWEEVVKPGAVEAFEISIPAASLTSPKKDLDKNMHKALNVTEHQDITFRLRRLEPRPGAPGALRGIGVLQIAGVEREVALDLTTTRTDAGLQVHGALDLLMTDYGITPPKAMLGMLKTDPKVTVTFDTLISVPST